MGIVVLKLGLKHRLQNSVLHSILKELAGNALSCTLLEDCARDLWSVAAELNFNNLAITSVCIDYCLVM